MTQSINRRSFLRDTALTGAGFMFLPQAIQAYSPVKKDIVRLGMIAVGMRGQTHLEEMLKRSDVEIIAMADPDKGMMAQAQALVKKYGKKAPVEYSNGKLDYQNLLKRDDIDAVFVASPWEWHAPQGIDAMKVLQGGNRRSIRFIGQTGGADPFEGQPHIARVGKEDFAVVDQPFIEPAANGFAGVALG